MIFRFRRHIVVFPPPQEDKRDALWVQFDQPASEYETDKAYTNLNKGQMVYSLLGDEERKVVDYWIV